MAIRKWNGETLVNTRTAGDQFDPQVAALADGGYVVAWQDGTGAGNFIRSQRFDALGHKVGAETTVIGSGGNIYGAPAITALADGGFWIGYTHYTGQANYIEGSVYNAKSAFLREQFSIYSYGKDDNIDVTAMGKGSAAAWYAPNGTNILVRFFDEKGVGGTPKTIDTSNSNFSQPYHPQIAGNPIGDKVAVVWRDNQSGPTVHYTVFGSNGSASTRSVYTGSGSYSLEGTPDVVWLNDNTFAMTFPTDTGDVRIQIVDVRYPNSPLTSPILLGNFALAPKSSPKVALLSDGGLAVAWSETSSRGLDQESSSVRLRVLDGEGNKVGSDILVNTTTVGAQTVASIAALADGRVVVSWTDGSKSEDDGSGDAIRSQIIDPRDGLVSGTGKGDKLYGHDAVGDEISGGGGSDKLYGLNGDDALYGGGDGDALHGGRGDDTLNGGRGKDSLEGGRGDDTFVFDTRLSAKSNADTVADFDHGHDEFELDHAIFTKLGAGELKSSAFKDLGAKGAKLDDGDRILYDWKTGDLSYDPDGPGKKAAVLFAHLDNHEKLSAADFLVV